MIGRLLVADAVLLLATAAIDAAVLGAFAG